jgi:hydroxymethylbilane synthase
MRRKIRVGSRESKLAIAQSELIINEIRAKHPELDFEIITMKTKGDIILDKRLDKIGGKGLFIKELENALLENKIDMAVHSLKDMPGDLPQGLKISAYSKREDPRDVLISRNGETIFELKPGAVIGTSSKRREVQIANLRPDIIFKTLRGNVNTRLAKLEAGEYDAIVLAAAGLIRLNMIDRAGYFFSTDELIPSVGQGIMCVETRENDDVEFLQDSVNCPVSMYQSFAERAFLIEMNGGCSIPIAAFATIERENIKIAGMLGIETENIMKKAIVEGSKNDAVELGKNLGKLIKKQLEV